MSPEEMQELERAAPLFRAITVPDPSAKAQYDCLSQALLWRDEVPLDRAPSDWWCIRCVWRCRTCTIIGGPPAYEDWWNRAKELFPAWIGFLPERCNPSEELASLYWRHQPIAEREARRLRGTP